MEELLHDIKSLLVSIKSTQNKNEELIIRLISSLAELNSSINNLDISQSKNGDDESLSLEKNKILFKLDTLEVILSEIKREIVSISRKIG